MAANKVLFYVQHLLGIGHQRRGATLTRALQAAGFDVTYVSGGHGIPNLNLAGATLAQLPPVRAVDLYFKQLVDEHERPIDDVWRERRRAALQQIYDDVRPDVIILELFPFGRRQMRFELLPLLEAAQSEAVPPLVVSSVRDILVAPPKPERQVEMLDLINRYFDRVLVHGDPALIPFDRTFPHADEIAGKIAYSGYVVDSTGERGGPASPGYDEVLVSAGGGAVGERLLQVAMAARPLTSLRDRTWRVLVGVKARQEDFQALAAAAGEGVIVERARGDFPSLLMNCALSISQGGYNTVMEALRAGCPTIVVPYAGGLETEQTLRANLLAERGLLQVVEEADLSEETIAVAVEMATMKRARGSADFATDGAETSARLIAGWCQEKAAA